MINKILVAVSSLVLSLLIFSSAVFFNTNSAFASQMGTDINDENSLGIVIEESNESLDGSKTSSAPDLGDDQAFPFIPGFGKNSGKD